MTPRIEPQGDPGSPVLPICATAEDVEQGFQVASDESAAKLYSSSPGGQHRADDETAPKFSMNTGSLDSTSAATARMGLLTPEQVSDITGQAVATLTTWRSRRIGPPWV